VVVSGGAEHPRDLPIPGRELDGVYFAMEYLPLQNKRVAGDDNVLDLWATGKHVVVIGGGDTGSDCVGTSNRHGASSVSQFELLGKPETITQGNPVWPYWPAKLRTSSSHEEGAKRDWAVSTKRFEGENGKVKELVGCRVEWKKDPTTGQVRMQEVPDSEFKMPADLVLLAMGFIGPVHNGLLDELGVAYDARGNASATTDGPGSYLTSQPKVFAAGDMRRGQSLVVWAIREGRQCARAADEFLMGSSDLPR
jgi:glutamate synthase (NADPH/NADH) small chain